MIRLANLILQEPEALAVADAILLLICIVEDDQKNAKKCSSIIANALQEKQYDRDVLMSLNTKVGQLADVFNPSEIL